MILTIARFILGALGAILIAGGQYTIRHPHDAAVAIASRLGEWGAAVTCFLPDVYPCGTSTGIGLLLFGALLVAIAIGLPPAAAPMRPEPPPLPHGPQLRRWTAGLVGAAVVLGAIGALYCRDRSVESVAVAAWLLGVAGGLAATVVVDRARRTGIGNPFCRWEWGAVLAITALDLILIAHDLTDWRWSGTPDEAHFFALARSLADGTSDRLLLAEDGVFGYHPVLSSYYQSLFMRAFGVNLFGWRLSSAAALAGSLPFLYLLTRELWGRRAALVASVFFGTAPLAVGFAHFGYNNAQVYVVVVGALGTFAWAQRRQSLSACYLAGCIGALSFYSFPPALLVLVLLVWLGLNLRGSPLRKGNPSLLLAAALGVALTALPALTHLGETAGHLLQQTRVAVRHEGAGSDLRQYVIGFLAADGNLMKVLQHWLLSTLYWVWSKTDHFQTNPLLDPIAGTLTAVGLWLCVGGVVRRSNARFLLVTYLISALLVCATSPYERPPLTRLLFLAPFTAMLGAIALDQLMRRMAGTSRGGALVAGALGTAVVVAAAVSNVAALQDSISEHYHGYGDGTTTELTRIAPQFPANSRIVCVQPSPSGMDSVDLVMNEYRMMERFTYLHGADASTRDALGALQPPFVVVSELRRREEVASVEDLLMQRFPHILWRDSDASGPWNVRYFYVPEPAAAGLHH